MHILASLEKKRALFWVTAGGVLVVAIGVGDYLTGSELSFALFYLVPVVFVTWFSGRRLGLAFSLLCGIVWFLVDILEGRSYSLPVIRYWNAVVRLGFFVVVSLLLWILRTLEREKEIARVDDLTGASSRRHFFDMVEGEIRRSQRYKRPFTLVYIDVDDFKLVNDRFGHGTGDRLLVALVRRAMSELRSTDAIGRLGGDEFAILMPETHEDAAGVVVPKIRFALLDEMNRQDWPVSLSLGALTYRGGPITADELIRRTDTLMYSVKKAGKNGIAYAVYSGGDAR